VEKPTITKSKNGAAGPEFNKVHAHHFFDVKGIIHCVFVPPSTMVNSDFYCDVLRRLGENARRKYQKFGATTTGSSNTTTRLPTHPKKPEFVTNKNMVIIPHPSWSPGLAPCDFALFPKLKG
jgi:histone-lysine N-methyltransferase SETMAR